MTKRVFFSFHYQDIIDFRANVVRNHWIAKPDRDSAGYFDASIWENAKKLGETAIKRLINDNLYNTTNTCVLVGSETYLRPWVRYEILKSFKNGNHIFAVHINSIKSKYQTTLSLGPNPLNYVGVTVSNDGKTATLHELIQGKWELFEKIDGSANYSVNWSSEFWGKGYNLGQFYNIYDWNADDGFNSFANWVK